jgi:hypothetical protein
MARIRKINVSQVEGNNDGVLPAGTIVAYDNDGAGYTLRVHNGVTEGGVTFNGSNGIVDRSVNFPNGDVGDTAGTADTSAPFYRSRATYDLTQLPTQYDDNTVVDNPNVGGLVVGRPWVYNLPGSPLITDSGDTLITDSGDTLITD